MSRSLEFFSGTPGLAAVKMMLADFACYRQDSGILLLDVTGAFLYGHMRRNVAIKIPFELGASPTCVGLLLNSLYGLRDAPQI